MNGEEKPFFLQESSSYKCRRNKGDRGSSLEWHMLAYANNYCGQDPSTEAKVSGWKFKVKQCISNYIPQIFTSYKGNMLIYSGETWQIAS